MQTDPTPKIGKGMLWLAWLSALLLLTLYFDDFLADKANPNQQPKSYLNNGRAVVELQQNRQGHYVANGTINGKPVTFLLDTGATQVSIPAQLQQELGLMPGYARPVSTANGTVQVYTTQIDSLTLGDIQLRDVDAHLNPGFSGRQILLGMSVLKQLDFEQRNKTLILTQNL